MSRVLPRVPTLKRSVEEGFQYDRLPRSGYIRASALLRFIPWGRTTLWARSKADFPRPVKLSARITAWRAEEVWAWIEAQGQRA